MMDGPADKSYGIHVAKDRRIAFQSTRTSSRYPAYAENGDNGHHTVPAEVEEN